jgi:dihydroflavonol-4-reductase
LDYAQVQALQADLNDPQSYASHLAGVGTVIHNAAMVSFKKADRAAILHANIDGTNALLQAAAQAGCHNFIFISSISSVGINSSQLSDEANYPDLQEKQQRDAYGYSKLVGELQARRYTDRMRLVILNPSVVIGPGSDRIERIIRFTRYTPLIPMLTTRNSFVDVRDVARAVVLALTHGRSGERYIVTAWNIAMLDFTRLVLQAAESRKLVVPVSGSLLRLGDVAIEVLDALRLNPGLRRLSMINVDKAYSYEKIKKEMGWEPLINIEQSIRETVRG